MKRDFDLIRELLLEIESDTSVHGSAFEYEPSDAVAKAYSLEILLEKGLIDAVPFRPLDDVAQFRNVRLTWDGHDFLDSVRDPEIWRASKEGVAQAGGFSLDLLKALAKGLLKKKIEHHTGVELDL